MSRQTHSGMSGAETFAGTDTKGAALCAFASLSTRRKRIKWASMRRKKKPLKWPSTILCSTCLIQRITAQYAPLIPLALCTTSISHHIYLVFFFFFKGLTQIPQCSDTPPMLLGFRSHPFFSAAQPHTTNQHWKTSSSAARHGASSSHSRDEFMSNCKAFKQYQLFNFRIDFLNFFFHSVASAEVLWHHFTVSRGRR